MPRIEAMQKTLGLSDIDIEWLLRRRICTLEDFIACDTEDLRRMCPQEERQTCEKAFDALSRAVEESVVWRSGVELLSLTRKPAFSFGCRSLDELLDGGAAPGSILEIAGNEASGKTQMCLQLAACAALKARAAVLYIDTSQSFSANRLANIMAGLDSSAAGFSQSRRTDLSRALKYIICTRCHDIYMTLSILEDIGGSTQHSPTVQDFMSSLRIVILDSASALISPVLGGSIHQGRALMVHLMRMLQQLCASRNLAVVVTNHTVMNDDGVVRPALGDTWKTMPSARLLMLADDMRGVTNVTLTRHTRKPWGQTTIVKVDASGVRDD